MSVVAAARAGMAEAAGMEAAGDLAVALAARVREVVQVAAPVGAAGSVAVRLAALEGVGAAVVA